MQDYIPSQPLENESKWQDRAFSTKKQWKAQNIVDEHLQQSRDDSQNGISETWATYFVYAENQIKYHIWMSLRCALSSQLYHLLNFLQTNFICLPE